MGSQVDKRKVVVKNVSLKCTEFTLTNFLEPVFDNDVEEIEYFENINETVLVHFANEIEEFDKCRRTDRAKKPIEGSCVELIQVFQPDGVLVQDLLPEITEDALTFYFENKKSGGRCDAVVYCKIYRSIQMAVVKFDNCQVACSVLKVKWHVPSNDHKVRLKPYIEPFHLDSLEKLSQKAEKESEKQIQQPVHLPNKSPSPQPALSRNKPASTENASQETSVESNDMRTLWTMNDEFESYADSDSMSFTKNKMKFCLSQSQDSTSCPGSQKCQISKKANSPELVETFIPEDNSCWQSYIKSDCEDISDELCRTPEDSPRQKPRLNTASNFTDEDFVSFTERNIENSPLEGEKSNVHVKGKLQMQDTNENVLKKKELEDEMERKKKENQWVVEMERKERERQLADEKARNETQAEMKIEKEVLQYKPHEVKLIRKRLSDEKFPHLVDFNDYTGNIVIEGSHSQLMETKLLIMSIKTVIENNNFTLPTMVSSVMKREAGKKCIKDCVIKFKSVEYSVVDSTFTCAALSRNDVDEVVEDLKHLIKQEHLTYGPEHNKYLASPAWAEKKDRLEKQFNLMMIACEPGSKEIKIEGLNGDVYKAKNEVQQELVKNSHKSDTFKVTGAKARCLQKSFQREITDLKDVISKCSGVFNDVFEGDMYKFNFSGEVGKVKQVSMELDKMVKTIWHETIVLVRDVVKDKDLELLITGLQKSNLKKFQIVFEMEHSCFLTFTLPKLPTSGSTNTFPLDVSHSPSMPTLSTSRMPEEVNLFEDRRSQSDLFSRTSTDRESVRRPIQTAQHTSLIVPSTKCKISVKLHSITKQKADILVNVVSSNRDLKSTKISQAFLNAGGDGFVQSYSGVASAGGNVICASNAGNLNCSHVLTIVLDAWDSKQQDASKAKLKKAVDDCFAMAAAQQATSIAFPPVGCGVLFKFPPKFVAASLVSAAKAAAKKGILQEIQFCIFDKSVNQDFLNEINPSSYGATPTFRSLRSYREFSDEGGFEESPIVRIGSTSIQTRQGDITKHRASVLVNVVSPDLELRRTAVSQAFMRIGGASLLMAFQKETTANPKKRIFVTYGYDLNCDYVYHVVLNKHSSPSSRQEFINTIEECFSLARKYNTKSIAFPAVGCGLLFKYNSSFVASSLISVAKHAASQSSHLKDVTFVIYDQDDYSNFLQELSSSSSMATTGQSEMLRTFSEAFHTSRKSSDQAKTAQITVVAKSKADCLTAKKAIIKELQTLFLHTEMITKDGITNLPRKALMDLSTLAKMNGIFIKFPDPKKQKHAGLKLKGEKNTVSAIKLRVQDILLTENSKVKKERTVQHAKPSAPGFIKHMAATSDHHTPGYWTYFKKGKSLTDHLSDFFALKKKTDWNLENVQSGTDIFNAINDLVIKTWKSSLVSQGKDAVGLTPHTIKVDKIERLENLKLFKGYCQNRAKVFFKAADNPIKAIKSLPGSNGEVLTTSMAAKGLRQEIYVTEINEHYVFHGTKQDKIKIICQNGLDSRVGSSTGMFGSGIYAAESSTKADQYADDKTTRTANGTPLCMILTRMVLGEPFMTKDKNSPKFTMPPCKKCHTACCPKHPDTFDSVIGDGSWLFREFVVYERDLTYPEYFITYHRL